MSQDVVPIQYAATTTGSAPPAAARVVSFLHHAKLISALTLVSRVLGVLRESLAARYFGTGMVSNAFSFAFAIPNLFRRLFGEGALSAAFIPLYSQSLKTQDSEEAHRFAASSVNLLIAILITLTVVGEIILGLWLWAFEMRPESVLAVKLTMVMLPYVVLVCGAAFLGAILQVHRRFGLIAAAPIVLNVGLIASTVIGARLWDLHGLLGQTRAIYFIAAGVLVAGMLQVAMLWPGLRQIGFRLRWSAIWTPMTRRMLKLSVPVALGAGVLQISVLLDRGISFLLAQSLDKQGNLLTHFHLMGYTLRYPLEAGASVRLFWAQLLYQFPLGVFAIALATAIFPALSADAMDTDRRRFKEGLVRGIRVTLWEGLPASIGLILVAGPLVQILFERGRFTPHDSELVARSLRLYAIAIWAFSLQQIMNRAYYALHDTVTPLVMSMVTLGVNLVVEIPLLWTGLAEAGMAAGTTASFSIQALVMVWMLRRRTGRLGLRSVGGYTLKLLLATAIMAVACVAIQHAPFFPQDLTRKTALVRLLILVISGGAVYLGACAAMGIGLEPMGFKQAKQGNS